MTKKKKTGPDRWAHPNFRVTDKKDQVKLEHLFQKSGMKSKTAFIRERLLGRNLTTATLDINLQRFCDRINDLIYQINKIGVNYNQTVHSINTHHGLNVSRVLLKNLSKLTEQLNKKMDDILKLETELRQYVITTKKNPEEP